VAAIYGTHWDSIREANGFPSIGDFGLTGDDVDFLSALTGQPAPLIKRMDLAERFPGAPMTRFLCHPATTLSAPDYCSDCLGEDARTGRDGYFRHQWAIAGVGHCHVHNRELISGCPTCKCDAMPKMRAAGSLVCLCCPQCGVDTASFSHQADCAAQIRPVSSFMLACEALLLDDLENKALQQISYRVLEDIAFLLFCEELPQAVHQIKTPLRNWPERECWNLTSPIRKAGRIFNASLMFPLSTTKAGRRTTLLASALAVIGSEGKGISMPKDERALGKVPHGLEEFFCCLDDDRREELVSRADAWPDALREKICLIINKPRSKGSLWKSPHGWAASPARRLMNDGILPKYKNL